MFKGLMAKLEQLLDISFQLYGLFVQSVHLVLFRGARDFVIEIDYATNDDLEAIGFVELMNKRFNDES